MLGLAEPVPSVDDEQQRLRALERDLGRLEGIVETLVTGWAREQEVARQARDDDRRAMNELGKRMEKVVEALANEIKEVAKTTATQNKDLATQRAVLTNTASLSRWLFGSVVATLTLAVGYAGLSRIQHSTNHSTSGEVKPSAVAPKALLP